MSYLSMKTMKRIVILLLCFLLSFQAYAADIEITEDYSVQVDKEALLAALYEADIVSIREAIALGLITCHELTAYYLERIDAYNDTFQCFITLCDDALEIADRRDAALANGSAQGKLFGVPIVVKDNIDYEGYPTTNGLGANVAPAKQNATVVQYLLEEGAVILGKTNMSAGAEDAISSINAAGLQTFHAYNPNLTSGGSSGGSAVAVSLNFAVAGLGTDTNSSLRYPSALNGCVSLRTTFKLIDREGCVMLNPSRDTVGAITRSVMDQAIMLDVMTAGAYSFTDNLDANALQDLRIGVLAEFAYPIESSYERNEAALDDEIQAAFDNAVAELSACGAEVITVSVPDIFSCIKDEHNLYSKLEKILTDNDISALIYPAYLHAPHYANLEYLNGKGVYSQPYITNCNSISSRSGAPEITVPIGQHSRGTGIGMEIISLKNNDQLLLDIAYSYTSQYDHRQAPQTAPSLHSGESEMNLSEFLTQYQQAIADAEELKSTPTEIVTTEPSEPESEETASEEIESISEPTPLPLESPEIQKPIPLPPTVTQEDSSNWYLVPIILMPLLACAAVFYFRKKRKRIKIKK